MKEMRMHLYEIVLLLFPAIFLGTPYFAYVAYACLLFCSFLAFMRMNINRELLKSLCSIMDENVKRDNDR